MSKSGVKARVRRLIKGELNADDLTRIFLFIREYPDCNEVIKEIGHFIAHSNERDQGTAHKSVRNWFNAVRFSLTISIEQVCDLKRLPSVSPEYFRYAVDYIGGKAVYNATKVRSREAKTILSKLADRLTQNPDGTWFVPDELTREELILLKYISSLTVARPAFTPEILFDGFIAILKSHSLISQEEIKAHKSMLKLKVLLFVVAVMHNSNIKIDNELTVKLQARAHNDSIVVGVGIPISQTPPINCVTDMLVVNLSPEEYCHPDLLSQEWSMDLELGKDGKLAPLV